MAWVGVKNASLCEVVLCLGRQTTCRTVSARRLVPRLGTPSRWLQARTDRPGATGNAMRRMGHLGPGARVVGSGGPQSELAID